MAEIELLRPHIWKNTPEVTAAVTTKNESIIKGGKIKGLNMSVSAEGSRELILKHRQMVLDALGLDGVELATGHQVHGKHVEVVTEAKLHPDTDGLITKERNLCLGIQVADCAAVLIADRKNKIIAALHAGWRGAVAGIVPDAVKKMLDIGAESSEMEVYISPCISLENFEVGSEVAEKFPETYVDMSTYDKPHINLKKYIQDQLLQTGVPESNISTDHRCTMEDKALYSYRREKDQSGRMMALICQH